MQNIAFLIYKPYLKNMRNNPFYDKYTIRKNIFLDVFVVFCRLSWFFVKKKLGETEQINQNLTRKHQAKTQIGGKHD
jgi:hypothetical protein